MSDDLARLGIVVDSTQVKTGVSSLQGLTQAGGLAERAMSMLGIAVAGVGLEELAREATQLAMRYETLGVVMGVVGKNAGYTQGQMEAAARQIEKSSFTMNESREAASKLAVAQIDMSKAGQLATIAANASVVGNTSQKDAMEALTLAIQTGMSRQLKHMGIVVDFTTAEKKMRDEVGATNRELTDYEVTAARTAEVIRAATNIEGAHAASLKTASGQIKEAGEEWENLKTKIGAGFLSATTASVFSLKDALVQANEALDSDAGKNRIAEISTALQGATEFAIKYADTILKIGEAFVAAKIISAIVGIVEAKTKWIATNVQYIAGETRSLAMMVDATTVQMGEARATAMAAEARVVYLAQTPGMRTAALQTANTAIAAQAAAVAETEFAVASTAAAAAQDAAAVSTRAGAAAMAMLGGPIGIITLLLTAGAVAWIMWGNEADDAGKKAKKATDDAREAIERLNRERLVSEANENADKGKSPNAPKSTGDTQLTYDNELAKIRELEKIRDNYLRVAKINPDSMAASNAAAVNDQLREEYRVLGDLNYEMSKKADRDKAAIEIEKTKQKTLSAAATAAQRQAVADMEAQAAADRAREAAKKLEEDRQKAIAETPKLTASTIAQAKSQESLNNQIASGSLTIAEATRKQELLSETSKLSALMDGADAATKSKLQKIIDELTAALNRNNAAKVVSAQLAANDNVAQENSLLEKQIELAGKRNDERAIEIAQYQEIQRQKREQGASYSPMNVGNAEGVAGAGKNAELQNTLGLANSLGANSSAASGLASNALSGTITSAAGSMEAQYSEAYASIKKLRDADLKHAKTYDAALRKLDQSRYDAMLALGENTFASLATGLSDMFGKNNAAYQAAFVIEKSFAIARATLNLNNAILAAMDAPWPANIPLIAEAIASGGELMSTIASVRMMEKGGTVGANESVIVGEKGIELFTPHTGGTITPNNKLSAANSNSSSKPMNVTVHNYGGVDVQTNQLSESDVEVIVTRKMQNDTPKIMSKELSNPNSKSRKTLASQITIQRKVSG